MKLALKKLLQAHPSIQVSTLLSGSLTTPSAKGAFVPQTAFESIATVDVGGGGAADITFSSIPANFTHLQIRGILQTNRSGFVVDLTRLQFNGDTGANYSYHWVRGGYSSTPNTNAQNFSSANQIACDGLCSAYSSASVFTGIIMDILDYTNTNKYKTVRTFQGFDMNGTSSSFGGAITLGGGNWQSSSAITSIKLYPQDGTAFNQYSSLALYGIRGA